MTIGSTYEVMTRKPSLPAGTIRAVLFDLGDTLVQWGPVDHRLIFEQAAIRTYEIWAKRKRRMPDFRRYFLHQWFSLHWAYLKQRVLRREMNAMRYVRRACQKLWLDESETFFRQLLWEWYQPLAEAARLEDGTKELLAELRRQGLQLGVVSNTFVPGFVLDKHLEILGLLEYLPVRIYSCDTGYRKPDRRIFLKAVEEMGVLAREAVYVGDLYQADVLGARKAGLNAVWKRPNTAVARSQRLDDPWTMRHLADLPALLERMAGLPREDGKAERYEVPA
ncbi:MAG: HAD family hydrolase [Phycisphaeraceae bacterium]|nr:HAD family hydrolase [Phycisphaeraceae bacterium]